MESKVEVEELGITVDDFYGNQPHLKAKRCNPRLKIYREFGLATLQSLAKETLKSAEKPQCVKAIDAISGCGLTGLQWKKHLQQLVHVTLAEHGDLVKLKSNALANCLKPEEIQLDGKRVPGDPYLDQAPSEVHVCCADAKAVLTMESFQFIFLNPPKNCVSYIEPALLNIAHNGILCLVVPDISVFARSPHVVQRYFAADVIKTEYLKELAARVVMASIARAAARYHKGINVLYVVTKEDFLLISVRIMRGHDAVVSSIKEIAKLLHCRFCEERVFAEQQLAPDENPYSKLPCHCKARKTGRTAVLIGPMWKGPIFNPGFLMRLQTESESKALPLSSNFHEVLSLLVTESQCCPSHQKETVFPDLRSTEDISKTAEHQTNISSTHLNTAKAEEGDPKKSDNGCPSQDTIELPHNVNTNESQSLGKRKDKDDTHMEVKRCRTDSNLNCAKRDKENYENTSRVPFYYSIKKNKKPTQPKLDRCVSLLQKAGHSASRTHFDPCCIRTSATVEQFLAVL